MSSAPQPRARKAPEERREEIIREAAGIALGEGLERVTLRAVAHRLGVRPGLISHYFPVADELVIAAFVRAVGDEREELVTEGGDPLARIARFVARVESPAAVDVSRLWLNARHLSRFSPALGAALLEQEALDRARLRRLIESGMADGTFHCEDAFDACIRIFVAVDGYGAYANNLGAFEHDAYTRFVTDATAWALGLDRAELRAAAGDR
ncbi:TetR family transcriptional regulator [Agromyces mediolanus]|uniref:TetR family transcriptional regulator n=1 Tax=Agromyces mediolanus TaxID=41986 RepID=UPI00383597AC